MNRLLEQAIAVVSTLPEDQQEALATRILDEIQGRPKPVGKWAGVADRLAKLDILQGRSDAFARHTRQFRDAARLRGPSSP